MGSGAKGSGEVFRRLGSNEIDLALRSLKNFPFSPIKEFGKKGGSALVISSLVCSPLLLQGSSPKKHK
jgi:hypothetical protein